MPIYVFTCQSCGLRFEELYRSVSDTKEHPCSCGGVGTRQVTAASFSFNHPSRQLNGALPPNTGTSDDWNYDKAIGRDASEKWGKIHENNARKDKIVREKRREGVGITSQHLVKTTSEEGYRVMSEPERKVINERRELARVVNDANVANNKEVAARAATGTPKAPYPVKGS